MTLLSESYYCVRSVLNFNMDFSSNRCRCCNSMVTLWRFLPLIALQSYFLQAAIEILLLQIRFSFALVKKLGMCQLFGDPFLFNPIIFPRFQLTFSWGQGILKLIQNTNS